MDDQTGPSEPDPPQVGRVTQQHAGTPGEHSATPDAERLRAVAEEVRGSFPRPLRGPELVLIDIDPHQLYAFWSVSSSGVEAARAAAGGKDAGAPMVLRMQPTVASGAAAPAFDVEVSGLQGDCYVDVWEEPRNYQVQLGIRCDDGRLVPLTFPAKVDVPVAGPAGQSTATAPAPPPAKLTAASTLPPEEGIDISPPGAEPEYAGPPRMFTDQLPEPVRHPVPLPPTEASEFDPFALTWQGPAPAPAAEPPPAVERPFAAEPTPAAAGDERLLSPAVPVSLSPSPPAPRAPSPMVQGPPVIHPLPLPPTEAGEFDPFALTHFAGETTLPAITHAEAAAAVPELRKPAQPQTRALLPVIDSPAVTPTPFPAPPPPATAGTPSPAGVPTGWTHIPSPMVQGGPVVHPLPLPPVEGGAFDPYALTGREGPPAPDDAPPPTIGEPAPATEPPASPDAHSPAAAASSTENSAAWPTGEGDGLPLENVLHLSSSTRQEQLVELEINAELRIYGRVKPGSALRLFGRSVPLRPDGSFSICRPLPNGALVLSSVMVSSGGDEDS